MDADHEDDWRPRDWLGRPRAVRPSMRPDPYRYGRAAAAWLAAGEPTPATGVLLPQLDRPTVEAQRLRVLREEPRYRRDESLDREIERVDREGSFSRHKFLRYCEENEDTHSSRYRWRKVQQPALSGRRY